MIDWGPWRRGSGGILNAAAMKRAECVHGLRNYEHHQSEVRTRNLRAYVPCLVEKMRSLMCVFEMLVRFMNLFAERAARPAGSSWRIRAETPPRQANDPEMPLRIVVVNSP